MKNLVPIIAVIAVVLGGGYGVYYFTQPQNVDIGQQPAVSSTASSTAQQLLADAYPLYSGLAWQSEVPNTMSFGETHTPSVISGFEADAQLTDGSDPATVFQSFTQYYADKLNQLGWAEDTTLAASGVAAYTKDDQYIILSYTGNAFSIFTGTGQ